MQPQDVEQRRAAQAALLRKCDRIASAQLERGASSVVIKAFVDGKPVRRPIPKVTYPTRSAASTASPQQSKPRRTPGRASAPARRPSSRAHVRRDDPGRPSSGSDDPHLEHAAPALSGAERIRAFRQRHRFDHEHERLVLELIRDEQIDGLDGLSWLLWPQEMRQEAIGSGWRIVGVAA